MPPDPPTVSRESEEDGRVAVALAEYQTAVDAGTPPPKAEFLARFPDLAGRLADCLIAMEAVRVAVTPPPRATTSPLAPGGILGQFRIVREVGRGGMGVVFAAVEEPLGRQVALKVLPVAGTTDGRAVQRFRHEAQAAATLQHPHIVPLFSVGNVGELHYFAMQFIDGESLAARLRGRRQPTTTPAVAGEGSTRTLATPPADAAKDTDAAAQSPTVRTAAESAGEFRAAARLIGQAADALQHAHECGIVHRDVKPANLLVDRTGHLWVADFGLAKLPDSDLTGTKDLMGTVRYMSPEQASGRAVTLDGRTDVYSLGVTFYECLIGRPPFESDDRHTLLRMVSEGEPTPPRKRNRAVPRDLETVCLKAMAKDPAERYQTAAAFRDDLQRYLDDRPVEAKPPTLTQRGRKWVKRNRVLLAASLLTLVLAMAVGLVGLGVAANIIDQKRQVADDALGRERAALRAAESSLAEELRARANERRVVSLQSVQLAQREWEVGNVGTAEKLLDGVPPELRQWEWHHLRRLAHSELGTLSLAQIGGVSANSVQFTSDGHLFAASETTQTWWRPLGVSEVERVTRGTRLVNRLFTLSPDGRTVLAAPNIILFGRDKAGGKGIGKEAVVTVLDAKTGERVAEMPGHTDGTYAAVFATGGRRVLTAGADGAIREWDAATGAAVRDVKAHAGVVRGLATAGEVVATYGDDDTLAIRARDGLTLRHTIRLPKKMRLYRNPRGRAPFDLSADGSLVALGHPDGTVQVWETATAREKLVVRAHAGEVQAVRFSPDGLRLATTAYEDKLVRVWDAVSGAPEGACRGHEEPPFTLAFSPDGGRIASMSAEKEGGVRVWDLTRPPGVRHVLGQAVRNTGPGGVRSYTSQLAYSPDGLALVVEVFDRISVWDPHSGDALPHPPAGVNLSPVAVSKVEFSLDSQSIFVMRPIGGVEWHRPTQAVTRGVPVGAPVLRYPSGLPAMTTNPQKPPSQPLMIRFPDQVSFSADRSRLVAIDMVTARSIHLYDVREGGRARSLHKSAETLQLVALSPDGRCVAAGTGLSRRSVLRLVSVDTGTVIHEHVFPDGMQGEMRGAIAAVAFHPSSEKVAVGLSDGRLILLDARTGAELASTQLTEKRAINTLAFSPNGERLACAVGGPLEGSSFVRLIDTHQWREVISLPVEGGADGVAFSPDGSTLAVVDHPGRVWVYGSAEKK
jgi:serine/threonine protein kinase/WD40 repeat protein